LSDDVVFQRYVEIEGRMHKVMTVLKMRGSAHSKDVRLYDVTEGGLVVGNTLYDYRGVITGVAQRHQASESGNSGKHTEQAMRAVQRPDSAWTNRLGKRFCAEQQGHSSSSSVDSELLDTIGSARGSHGRPGLAVARPGRHPSTRSGFGSH